jgi:hypothetical protein
MAPPGGHAHSFPCKQVKRYKRPVRVKQNEAKLTSKMKTYLIPLVFASFQVDCCIKFLRCFLHPSFRTSCLIVLQSKMKHLGEPPLAQFDLDLFPIGINNRAFRCIANAPHLFENLRLTSNKRQVNGICNGVGIRGK